MWVYGQHLRIAKIDKNRVTQDSCIVASFQQLSRASARDTNVVDSEIGYVGELEAIIELNYHKFTQIVLKVQWFRTDNNIRKGLNGFYCMDSSKLLRTASRETYVLPEHCQQAFFYKNPNGDPLWSIVHVNPRGRRIFESHVIPIQNVDVPEGNEDAHGNAHRGVDALIEQLQNDDEEEEYPSNAITDTQDHLQDEPQDLQRTLSVSGIDLAQHEQEEANRDVEENCMELYTDLNIDG